jgi:hypothetical protein
MLRIGHPPSGQYFSFRYIDLNGISDVQPAVTPVYHRGTLRLPALIPRGRGGRLTFHNVTSWGFSASAMR